MCRSGTMRLLNEVRWDRKVETTVKLDHTRPDLVLFDREKEEFIVVDFSVPPG